PVTPSRLEEQFRGLLRFAFGDANGSTPPATSALSEYQNELRTLLVGLRASEDASGAPVDADALLARTSLIVQRLLAPLDNEDRAAVQGLLTDPIEYGRADARDRDAARLAERWRREVIVPAQHLLERYPFTANAAEDVSLDELQGFLAPRTGSLWRFVDTELASRLSESGGRYDNRASQGNEPLSDDLLECLGAARELRDALFGQDAAASSVPFAVRLGSAGGDVSSMALQVDGLAVEGTGGDGKWLTAKWSGRGAAPGAAVLIRGSGFGDEIRRTGPWGLMRLLADGGLRPSTADEQILEASWQLNHGLTRVTVQVRPDDSGLSLRPAAFRRLRCPLQPFARHRGDAHDRNSEARSLL
ncbi:MAG TPA: type VI secretion IcmF C-terminal domain-containing protein, partial [Polyangiaceae bacterium]|nr:type VI secretion IcmF C-terminal domain-containing protein [Polyangiaceae bacterium]